MILLKPVLLLLFNEEYITDRVNTLYNDYSKNIAGYSSSYTGDSSLQSDYDSYVSNVVKQTVISRVLNIAEECGVEVNNVKVELNDKSILNKSDTDYSSVITGIDISVKNKKSVSEYFVFRCSGRKGELLYLIMKIYWINQAKIKY